MGFTRKYKKFATGHFVQFSYSPKWLDKLSFYDRKPLGLFLGYDSNGKHLHMINMHWLTVAQRKRVVEIIRSAMKMTKDDTYEFGKPMPLDIYRLLKSRYPIATIAYRMYFANRMRNVSHPAWMWEDKDIQEKIINTDTEKIVGVSPETIQKLAVKALRSRGKTQTRKAKRRAVKHRGEKVRRRRK